MLLVSLSFAASETEESILNLNLINFDTTAWLVAAKLNKTIPDIENLKI